MIKLVVTVDKLLLDLQGVLVNIYLTVISGDVFLASSIPNKTASM